MTTDFTIKQDLSYVYKILAHLKLDDHTYTHLSARSQENKDSYYIYPFGYMFEEVEPELLMHVSLNSEVLDGHEHQYNKTGYYMHGAIYEARQDINAIFHIHTPEIVAVSAVKDGLMPISQWALHFYGLVSYHEYNSLTLEETQQQDLVHDLGKNYVMLMRNHGAIICGRTIHEAMFYTYHLHKACQTQVMLLSQNREIIAPDKHICDKTVKDLLSFEKDLGMRDWIAWKRFIDKMSNKK